MEMIWYLADLVTEIRVEGEESSVVQFELYLITAKNAAEAYDKALRIGGSKTTQHLRNDGRTMEFIFRGFNDLIAVDEQFADGARILNRSQPSMTEDEIRGVITSRDYLRAIQAEGLSNESETVH